MSSDTASTHYKAWQAWQDHSSDKRQDTGLSFASILRSSYGNYHVIRVDHESCDLQGFASAGFATWTDEHFDLYDAKRAFSDPGPRSGNIPGSLQDTIRFGRARYEWEGKDFIVYKTMFTENWIHGAQQALFILTPCGDKVVDGHHTDIDALLLACGSWTKELHGEIFVFDQARWTKSKDLYKSVDSSSWDDVILHPDMKAKLIEDVQGFFENQELYKSFGIPWKRGVILHGVPGNGKTISIKALINSLSKREPEPIPSLARQMAPCVLIFEDLDSMVTDKVRSYFLNEIDFNLPDENERALYCHYWYQKLLNHPVVAFPEDMCHAIAKLTEGFSFAYLKELFITSLLIVARGSTPEDALQPDPSDHSSSTDTVVVEAPTEEVQKEMSSGNLEEGKEVTAPQKSQVKKIIPKIEVSEELQRNTLLSVITRQAQALLDEMDNSEDGSVVKSRVTVPVSDGKDVFH
ncbi:hypothetical protein N0V82_006058 [Gnomoniopsis sp. IMI 355080]|nr:hypothetical protein N0V82_006058 [Gnomoniopsis sp. IMI 355080]